MRKRRWMIPVMAAAAVVLGTGCSRSVLNYQVAECIGTLDKYENNEPVETPKMKAERERQESEAALEQEKQAALDQAEALAQEYWYEEAIAELEEAQILKGDDRAKEAMESYQAKLGSMYEYQGDIPHFSFTNLVIDTERAFDGDERESMYRDSMITLTEFQNILQTLYESGYVLIDLHSLAEETKDAAGDVVLEEKKPMLPQGKKPLVLSVDNLSYSSVRNGDGVATKLAFDKDGKVAAVYTDAQGHELKGAYDVVPVLEEFIQEHPDFSYRGARGIISVAGSNGIFGYEIGEDDHAEDRETVKKLASALREQGWTFASAGYSYQYMGDMSYDGLYSDMTKWQETTGALIGECDTVLYPAGSEVDYSSEKGAFLINHGFRYLVGMWTTGDHVEVNERYLRQTRRMVTGYVFRESPNAHDAYFSVKAVLDPER